MTPLRWLVLATAVPAEGGLGGVVRYITELTGALARRDDIDVHVLGDHGSRPFLEQLVGTADHVHTLPVSLPGAAGALVERHHPLAASGTFDVVQGTKHLIPRKTPALGVLTVHDTLLLDRPDDFPRVKRALLPRSYRRSLAEADLPVCVSEATRSRLAAWEPAAATRATVVPLAVAGSLRDAVPEPVAALADGRFALVVGDASPRKNLSTISAAWPAVQRAVPDARLAIAGPPDWSGQGGDAGMRELVESGVAITVGRIPDAQLRWCYEHAAVVLCPSLAEGFGLPVAEALAFGARVVVSDDAALVEAAAGRAAAVVPATDVAAWTRAIVAAYEGARRGGSPDTQLRDWDDVAAETVAVVREAIAASPHLGDTS